MSPSEAETGVNRIYADLMRHWQLRIHAGPFMSQLREGTLPLPCIRRFFKDWSLFSVQVVALNASSLYFHLPFFAKNFDLLPAFADKVAEELVYPQPPGHILLLLETARALGLEREELLGEPASPAGRSLGDYCRRVFHDGSLAELWGLHVYEESIGHWSNEWTAALTSHYGFTREQAIYFTAHAEADLLPHEGRLGHGPLNRMILQRILEQELTGARLGYEMRYCALTMVDLHAVMEKNALENPYP